MGWNSLNVSAVLFYFGLKKGRLQNIYPFSVLSKNLLKLFGVFGQILNKIDMNN